MIIREITSGIGGCHECRMRAKYLIRFNCATRPDQFVALCEVCLDALVDEIHVNKILINEKDDK